MRVKKRSTNSIIFILVILLITSGGFTFWKLIKQAYPSQPIEVVRAYLQAGEDHEVKYTGRRGRVTIFKPGEKYLHKPPPSMPLWAFKINESEGTFIEGEQYWLSQGPIEGDNATVYIKPGLEASKRQKFRIGNGVSVVLVKEDSKWKIDLLQTMIIYEVSRKMKRH